MPKRIPDDELVAFANDWNLGANTKALVVKYKIGAEQVWKRGQSARLRGYYLRARQRYAGRTA